MIIEKISSRILKYLLQSEVIEDTKEVRDYYRYGIEITVSSLLGFAMVFLIGLLFGSLIESLVFLLCFVPLRQFTGGYHAKTYFLCNLTFSVLFTTVLVLYYLTKEYMTTYAGILMIFSCCVMFFSECPVENENKPLSEKKKKVHNTLSVILGAGYGTAGIALMLVKNRIGVMILYTLVLITILIRVATFRDLRKR